MVDIKNFYKTLECPDYGSFKILMTIPITILSELFNSNFDIKKSDELYKKLITTISREKSIDITTFTEKGHECIARYLVDTYEVDSIYLNSIGLGKSIAEALFCAIKKSHKAKKTIENLRKISKQLADPMMDLVKKSSMSLNMVMEPFRINQEILRSIGGVHSLMHEYTQGFGAISALEKSMKNLSIGNIIGKGFADRMKEINQSYKIIIPKINVPHEVMKIFEARKREYNSISVSIAEALKPLPSFLEISDNALKSLQALSFDIPSLYSSLELANKALLNSEKIVKGANDYFSKYRGTLPTIPEYKLPLRIRKFEESYLDNLEQEEWMLHYEASESIISSNELTSVLDKKIHDTIDRKLDNKLNKYSNILSRMDILSHPPSFFHFIKRVVQILSEDYWEVFWETKGKKFVSRPERLIQSHIGIGIGSSFGDIAFIGKEIKKGNGYIDLLINFLGRSYIVEFKLVGPGWGRGLAVQGLDQLDGYMETQNQHESYLVILDGRKTNRGEPFEEEYKMNHGKVYVITKKIYW